MSVDILALNTHSYFSRDTEAFVPVFNYLRLANVKMIHGQIHNGYYLILKHQPSVVFLDCIFGGRWHAEMAFFAKKMGCKVVSLMGEGANFARFVSNPEEMWGWLAEQVVVWDAYFFWNHSAKQFVINNFPFAEKNIYVTGGTGYDRYRFVHPERAEDIPSKYQATIGVGCWDFSRCGDSVWSAQNRLLFSEILLQIIRQNRHVFFKIKLHPGSEGNIHASGVDTCANEENARILPLHTPIIDCIADSDIWLTFESNTALEAWLMGKQTALLNPTGTDFPFARLCTVNGQPNFADAEQWTNAINSFLETRELPGFRELENERQKCYEQLIGHSDGLNHVRAGNIILDVLQQSKNLVVDIPDLGWRKKAINAFISCNFGKYIQKLPNFHPWLTALKKFYFDYVRDYSEKEFQQNADIRMKQQIEFYAHNSYSLEFLRSIY
ncbi:BFO_1060 family glycosyltransferase [uncultured Desulfovibrio sp.]|uniref:BFO_1060 family glycosyltransferase n=1 Tax=uncultured Desulfovibrio sp. TaxID=167968 RepID=UPI0026086050|nr:hypothetical protein [uncultured Desulfovibrio sp.]